jgi:hypothetical protein
MDCGDPRAAKANERYTSFLYQSPDQGMAGTQDGIEVGNVPAIDRSDGGIASCDGFQRIGGKHA